MTAPYTLPPQKKARNPFDDLPDLAPQATGVNPFDSLPDLAPAAAEKARHEKILHDNELGRRRDETENGGVGDQVASGLKDVYAAVRHPIETVKGMAKSAARDIRISAGERIPRTGEIGGVPSDLTPEETKDLPKALINTAALAAMPLLPASSLITRGAVNAGLGAINTPEQPLRGATAGLVLGETLHRAPELVPSRVARPRIRLNETSEPLRAAAFRRTLGIDDAPPLETAERPNAPAPAGFEPTSVPSRRLNVNPRNPKGFTAEVNPFDELPDLAGKQKPIATQSPADVFAARAEAMNDPMRPRRRPAGEVTPPADTPAPAPVPDVVVETPAPRAQAEAEPLPSYPEGFAMGGPEGRVPKVPPAQRITEPQPIPEGATAETAQAALDLKPGKFRGHSHDDLAVAALDAQTQLEAAQAAMAKNGEGSAEMQRFYNEKGDYTDFAQTIDGNPFYAKGPERAIATAKAKLAQIEREFALRGVRGDDLADIMAAAKEQRIEREGMAQDASLDLHIERNAPPNAPADPWADWVDETPAPPAPAPESEPPAPKRSAIDLDALTEASRVARPAAPAPEMEIPLGAGALPEGAPKRPGRLINPASFPENVRGALADADRGLQDAGVRKTAVTMDEQRLQARAFAHQMADDIGMSRLDLDPKKVGRLTGAEIGAVKEAAVGEMDKIIALEQQMADPMTPESAKAGLSQLLDQAKQNRDTALNAVVRASSQKGRDLGFLRQVAQRTLDPDVWMLQAKKALGDLPLTDEVVANLQKLVREASEACG